MGKTMGRWLRELLQGGKKKKKVQEGHAVDESGASKEKRRWGFTRSKRDDAVALPKPAGEEWRGGGAARSYASSVTSASSHSACAALHRSVPGAMDEAEQNKRAIVVAAATAAVAEAAVAAAQAAAAVVRLTSSGRSAGFYGAKAEFSAAIKIQTAFRGYLARRALRALRSLVKLQALVRGHIVRKQAAETLRCMQALVRVQARARVCRALSSEISLRRRTGNLGLGRKVEGRSWVDQWAEEQRLRGGGKQPPARVAGAAADDENHDRVLEVDTGKPRLNPKRRNGTTATQQLSSSSLASDQNSRSFATSAQFSVHSPSSVDMPLQQSLSPLVTATMVSDEKLGESPNLYSSSGMRTGGAAGRGTLAAALSDCSSSFFSSYSDHPSYMSCTESSRAKTRSQSAPKQRPEFEKPAAGGQRGHVGVGGAAAANRTAAPASSSMQVKFTSKAYPGSGRLDRLGMPVRF